MKYVIYLGILCIIYLIYRGVSKYLDYAAKVLLTVLPVSAIVYLLTINMPYNELLILPVVGYMIASILNSESGGRMMEPKVMVATLAAIEVVFLFLASLSVKANELPLAFICIIICIVAMVILVVGLA